MTLDKIENVANMLRMNTRCYNTEITLIDLYNRIEWNMYNAGENKTHDIILAFAKGEEK